jgi:hypothetical protein
MRYLRPSLGLTRSYRKRNPDMRNRSKVNNITEDLKVLQKSWSHHVERMDKSRLLKLTFQYQPRGRREAGRPRTGGKIKKTWTLKEQVLRPNPCLLSRRRRKRSKWGKVLLLYIESTGRMISEQGAGKDTEYKRPWWNLKYYPGNCLAWLEKRQKISVRSVGPQAQPDMKPECYNVMLPWHFVHSTCKGIENWKRLTLILITHPLWNNDYLKCTVFS